ncbi:MAG TPA: hypothetical protein VF800_22795 [Telluria sp.]|jgi:hypothetical protein
MTAAAYEHLRTEGYALAGQVHDLQQRVRLYQRVYQDSGKRFTFALIAAHGTLWASGYFKLGALGARIASLPWLCIPGMRARKLEALDAFIDGFRSINRQVCAESYAIFYYTKQHGGSAFIRSRIGERFTDLMVECHASCAAGTEYPRQKREALFHALIDWEQDHIVVGGVEKAFAGFDWPVIAWLARRPVIRFAYFGKHDRLRFNDFSLKEERLSSGLHACQLAEDLGLQAVEDALDQHKSARTPLSASVRRLESMWEGWARSAS